MILTVVSALVLLLPVSAAFTTPLPRAVDHDAVRVPRQVKLIVEPGQLLVSNIRLNRIDAIALDDGEAVISQAEARAAVAVVTSARILAYGPVIGWRELQLEAGEQVEYLEAEDYAVFILTDRRYLNFNADSGIWAEQPRALSQSR